jgi:hypothetical protein
MVSKRFVWGVFIGAALFFLVGMASAADAQVAWQKSFGNPGNEVLRGIEKVSNGYYLFGSTNASDGSAVFLTQIDVDGKEISNKTINLPGQDLALDIEPLKDGMVLLVRGSMAQSGQSDIGVLKLDGAGKTVWKRTYDMPGYTSACKVVRTSDGGFLIVGNTTTRNSGTDVLVIKTDVEGNPVWTKTYPGVKNDNPRGAIALDDGSLVIVGSTESASPLLSKGLEDIFIMKVAGDGSAVWNHNYGMSGNDRAYDVVQTADRGFAIIGSTTDARTGNQTIALIRTDAGGGNKLLEKHFGGPQVWSSGSQIRKSSSGGFLIAGVTTANNTTAMELFETDAGGKVAWEKQVPLKQDGTAHLVRPFMVPADKGYLLAGLDLAEGANATADFIVAKIMPPGTVPAITPTPAVLTGQAVLNATVNTT